MVDPIFADGVANIRSRAAPSARIEPHILFLSEHYLDNAMLGWMFRVRVKLSCYFICEICAICGQKTESHFYRGYRG